MAARSALVASVRARIAAAEVRVGGAPSSALRIRARWFTAGSTARTSASSTSTSNPIDELNSRGLIQHSTSRAVAQHLASPDTAPRTIYLGIDPSAPSLHLGNLLPLFALFHLANAGHRCIALVGGATGSIGDPSGRSTERSALAKEELEHNLDGIVQQLSDFFGAAGLWAAENLPALPPLPGRDARKEWDEVQALLKRKETLAAVRVGNGSVFVVNNRAFYEEMNILNFLGDVGRHVRIGDMLARDSVKRRIQPTPENPDPPGLSFTEFSYQLLQAYDFSLLHRSPWNCTVQLGGSDQLGNIMAGIDLIRRQSAPPASGTEAATPAFGLTVPLLTTSSGAKFGKSAGNAVWLDRDLTSDLDLYQYFLRHVTDADAPSLLSKLTLLAPHARTPDAAGPDSGSESSPRAAQTLLASHLTSLLRGDAALKQAQLASRMLFTSPSSSSSASISDLTSLTRTQVEETLQGLPLLKQRSRSEVLGTEVWKLVADVGLVSSRSEGRRTLQNGGVYLNSRVLAKGDLGRVVGEEDVLGTQGSSGAPGFLIVRSGKSSHAVILID
ncbi:nuclear GTP-binding protein nug1 [Tilletia horrida]|nr:nuclear GTP-binding protein nug1 [Tilletia horrida]